MNWNKTKVLLLAGLILFCCICGFGTAVSQENPSAVTSLAGVENVPVEIFIDYQNTDPMLSGIIQFPEVTEINDDEVLGLIYTIFGPKSENSGDAVEIKTDACSCFYVPVNTESGTVTLMGRNLDLDQSVCPGWIFYTNIPGKYKSFNMGYFEDMLRLFGVPTMDEVRETHEIPYRTYQLLTYVTTDAVNEKGLYIEVNMRNQTDDLVCTGTNPSSDIKVCNAVLIRYLIDRCATIDDVLNLVKTLDIYSPNPNVLNSQFALSMMDATGRCGVMEFVNNEIVWHDSTDTAFWNGDTPCHTNYWITPEAYAASNSCNGESRYEVLQDAAKSITSEEGMWDALAQIYRKQFFTNHADETTYDVVSDCCRDFWGLLDESLEYEAEGLVTLDDDRVQEVQAILDKHPEYKDKSWDATYLKNPENRDDILTCYNFITDVFNQLTPEVKREDTQIEYSAFTYVAESGSAEMRVKFFEHPEEYTFGFQEKQTAAKSPAPVLGILAGLGIAGVLLIRRK